MYARDVEPSRIFRAKVEVARLIKELSGARFAAVAFAGEPMGFPLSADGAAIAQFLRQLDPNDMPVGGTAIGRALEAARDLLRRDPKSAEHKRVILLITDGEDLEGRPEAAAQAIGAEGTVIHVVQIGGRTPERIPEIGDTGEIVGWRTDGRGKPLTTQLTAEGEAQLSTIASATGGTLVRAEKGSTGIEKIAGELRQQMQTEYGERVETVYADVYFYPLGLAILLLILEVFLGDAPARTFQPRLPPPPAPGPRPRFGERPLPPRASLPPPQPRPRPEKHGGTEARRPHTEKILRAPISVAPCLRGNSGSRGPANPLPRWKRWLAGAFAAACIGGAMTSAVGGCSGWDPTSPFEHNAPEVDKALAELDAGNARAAEDILEDYLGTGPCTDAGIGLPDAVKLKPNGAFDLGLTLFYLAESFGQPFGDEEEGLEGPNWKRNARLRGIEINCALIIVLAIANDPNVAIELRARAYYLAGNLEFLRRRYEEAVKQYDEALKLIPGVIIEAGGDEIGRDAAWNRAIAMRRIPQVPLSIRELDGGEDEEDGGDGGDQGDAPDGKLYTPDDAGDVGLGNEAGDGESPTPSPDAESPDKITGDAGTPSDAPLDDEGGAAGDAGTDGPEPQPNPVGQPEPVAPDPQSEDRILDQLEQAPTYQEQEAKNRGSKRGRIRMEDK
jgi:Ca-activated chloride channel family protein